MAESIRKSAISGTWYPDKPEVLRSDINRFFRRVTEDAVEGAIVGLVAPHAGYLYSGQVAAHAYRMLQGQVFDAVIVIGPSHRMPFVGVSVYDRGGYETPLGTIPVDGRLAERIMLQSKVVSAIPHVHVPEHSIEIQLPFLQVALGSFSFVPLLMGSQDRDTCEDLARAIFAAIGDKKVLMVGSSDLSHFHNYDRAVEMDARVLSRLSNMDADGLLADLEGNISEACGGGPAAVVMMASKKLGANKSKLLKYANSGDITNERNSVVGYAAAVFLKGGVPEKADHSENISEDAGAGLTEGDKKLLLDLVRKAIEAHLAGSKVPEPDSLEEVLQQKRGAFVTLKKHGRLRGCIGYIEARKPLYKTIEEMAVAAAFHDPRFPSLTKGEFDDLSVEISVLSPLQEIHDIQEIEVGRHGLYIMKGHCCGLLLPQVAVECSWDRMTFLRETCRKAGLPAHAWQDVDAKLFIFSADIFGSNG